MIRIGLTLLACGGLLILAAGLSVAGPAPSKSAKQGVDTLLDQFHTAAAEADWETYFGLMREDMVFLGTDVSERWDKPIFKAYAGQAKNGWTYKVTERHVDFESSGGIAWFDEVLVNAKYGVSRGSGIAIRDENGVWKLAQYHLTFPIPNALAAEMTKKIQEFTAGAK